MGIKLIVEVMDHWRDAGLTKGEKDDLLILAENANDGTRETFQSVHAAYILRRAGKTPVSWRNAIDALKRKGVLEYAVRDGRQMSGRPGQHAVYRMAVLCPEAPHDGLRGQCTRMECVTPQVTHPDEWVTPQVTHSEAMGHLSDDPSKRLGHLTGAECVTPQVTPSPLLPSLKISPLSDADAPDGRTSAKTGERDLGDIDSNNPARLAGEIAVGDADADQIVAAWKSARGTAGIPPFAPANIARSARTMLAEGITTDDLCAAAAVMAPKGWTDFRKHLERWSVPPQRGTPTTGGGSVRTEAIRACRWCDDYGDWYRNTTDTTGIRCTHPDGPPAGHPAHHTATEGVPA